MVRKEEIIEALNEEFGEKYGKAILESSLVTALKLQSDIPENETVDALNKHEFFHFNITPHGKEWYYSKEKIKAVPMSPQNSHPLFMKKPDSKADLNLAAFPEIGTSALLPTIDFSPNGCLRDYPVGRKVNVSVRERARITKYSAEVIALETTTNLVIVKLSNGVIKHYKCNNK